MITAVLYSGQARTIARCLPTQQWHVFRHLTDVHFFVLWQNEPNGIEGVKLLEEKYGKERVHAKLIDDPTDLPMVPLKKGAHAPFANAASHPQLMLQHWYQNEVWRRFKEWPRFGEVSRVVRMRGDNFFHSMRAPQFDEEPQHFVCVPWWGRFGGINDRFAFMDLSAAAHYFEVYPKIQKLLDEGCPFHPETLSLASLQLGGVAINDTLLAEFSTLRLNGDIRRYEVEVSPADVAHLAASSR